MLCRIGYIPYQHIQTFIRLKYFQNMRFVPFSKQEASSEYGRVKICSDNIVKHKLSFLENEILFVCVCVCVLTPRNYWAYKHQTWHDRSPPRGECHKGFVTKMMLQSKMIFLVFVS